MAERSRAAEGRDAETRAAEQLPSARPDHLRYEVDPTRKPASMSQCWIREYCLGAKDDENIVKAFEDGYRPVKAADYPGMSIRADAELMKEFGDVLGRQDSFVRRGGAILMERPADKQREHLADIRRETQDKMALANRFNVEGNPTHVQSMASNDPRLAAHNQTDHVRRSNPLPEGVDPRDLPPQTTFAR